VKKARRAGALYGGREPSRWRRKTLGSQESLIVRLGWHKDARGRKRGRKSLFPGPTEGDAREVKKLRRARGPDPT
jgi:hypothetical protein